MHTRPDRSTPAEASANDVPGTMVFHSTCSGTRFNMPEKELSWRKICRIEAVANTHSGCNSRSRSRPRTWSRSALASTTPEMGDCRNPARGCSSGVFSICERRSGEAPSRNQDSPSPLTATCAWERGFPAKVPARRARQFAQAQFH